MCELYSIFIRLKQVNKWLAEHHTPEQQMTADFLSAPRRRRPRIDPSLLDWKKLTGDENVAVINRDTGKKVCCGYLITE